MLCPYPIAAFKDKTLFRPYCIAAYRTVTCRTYIKSGLTREL